MKQKIKHQIEASLAYVFLYVFRYFIPLKLGSKIGYFLGKEIFSRIPIKRKQNVINNIKYALPNENHNEIYKKSWGVFCSILTETTNLEYILKHHNKFITIINKSGIDLQDPSQNQIFFSGHLGNWELLGVTLRFLQKKSYITYKAPSNQYVEAVYNNMRSQKKDNPYAKTVTINKKSIINIQKNIKHNNYSILGYVDQKVKEGLNLTFFGKRAFTLGLLPLLSIKNNKPLIPARVVRKNNFKFDVIFEKPLEIDSSLDENKQIEDLAQKMNNTIEEWVKEYPEQWFWLHRRWS